MPLFGRRKVKATPNEAADVFISEFVANDALAFHLDVDVTPQQQNLFNSKCKLYRLAVVLMTLMNEEKDNPKALQVRESIETRVFGVRSDSAEALASQVRSAMTDLQDLLAHKTEMSWARQWLEAIGIDVVNPVELTLFASNWMDQYIAVTKSLLDLRIT